MNQIVLQRKLTIPSSGKLFNRPELVEKLDAYSQSPLTLITAPAGYGKTSLVCDWLQYARHPVYWLSLDEQNNLPSSFWIYLIACLRRIDRDLDGKAEKMLEAHFIEDYCLITDLVLASLEKLSHKWNRPSRAVIVLDDFQFIDHPQILQSFNRFLDYLPSWLQIIITSRKPPALMMANRCSKSSAHIIQANELIFQPKQIAEFLTLKLELELSDTQLNNLFNKTEGWAAAIQLIGLALKSGADINNYNLASDSLLADFLFEEVFSQLENPTQELLTDISILDHFDLKLCQLFNPTSKAEDILESLIRQGLFISEIENTPKNISFSNDESSSNSYRLHSLFRQWIIENRKLSPERAKENKETALNWLSEKQNFHEALELSIELKDWQSCSQLMKKLYPSLIQVTHFDHLSSILERIPKVVIQSLPHLCLLAALLSFNRYDYKQVKSYTNYLESFFNQDFEQKPSKDQEIYSKEETTSLLMGSMLLRAQIARFAGKSQEAKVINSELETLFYPANTPLNCWVVLGKGVDYFFDDEIQQSIQQNKISLEMAKEVEDGLCVVASLCWLLHGFYHNGQVLRAIKLAEEHLTWLQNRELLSLPNISSVYAAMAILYLENNDIELAWHNYTQLLDTITDFTELREVIYNKFHTHFHLLSSSGHYQQAKDCLQQLSHYEDQLGHELGADFSILLNTQTFSAVLELKMGNMLPLLQLVNQSTDVSNDAEASYRFRSLFENMIQASGRMIMTSGDEDGFAEIAHSSSITGNIHRQITCYLIPAKILFAQGEKARALAYLKLAFEQASQYQFINLIIEEEQKILPLINLAIEHDIESSYCQTLLTAIKKRQNYTSANGANAFTKQEQAVSLPLTDVDTHPLNQNLIESLSPRELEVLSLINQGNRNKQIAEQLSISLSTVKRHLQNAYQKLQVNSRTEAMAILNNKYVEIIN